MNKRLAFLTPLLVFSILIGYFAIGLTKDPSKLTNMLAGQPVPEFTLAGLQGRDAEGFKSTDLLGDVSLVNVFGSWCEACLIEHPFLMEIHQKKLVPIHAIDWREVDSKVGALWLKKNGDPYTLVGNDPKSKAAISFGVTGAPETFLVDKKGIIRFKHVGPINKEIWQSTIEPLIVQLKKESSS